MTDGPTETAAASPKPPSLGEIVSAAGFAITLVTAWLYVAGWTYAYYYFDHLRIPLLLIELPYQHYLVYGGLVVWKNPIWATAIVLVLVALALVSIPRARAAGRFVISAAVLAVILGLFALARIGGVDTAGADFEAERASDFGAYPRVAIALKREAIEAIGDRLADIPHTDCGRLLLVSGGRMFLIRPIRGAAAATLDTFVVGMGQVDAIRVVGEYRSCP